MSPSEDSLEGCTLGCVPTADKAVAANTLISKNKVGQARWISCHGQTTPVPRTWLVFA